LFSHILI